MMTYFFQKMLKLYRRLYESIMLLIYPALLDTQFLFIQLHTGDQRGTSTLAFLHVQNFYYLKKTGYQNNRTLKRLNIVMENKNAHL